MRRALASTTAASVLAAVTLPVIQQLTVTGWVWLHERLFGRGKAGHSTAARIGGAALAAIVANIVDDQLTRTRLRPGIAVPPSRKSLFVASAVLAVGLALAVGSSMRRTRRARG